MVRGRPKNTSVWEESDDEGVDGAKLEGSDLHKYAQRGNAKAVAMIIRRGGRSKLKVTNPSFQTLIPNPQTLKENPEPMTRST